MRTINGGHGVNAYGGKGVLRVVLASAAILLVPLLAMQFTNEVQWTVLDFVAAAVLLLGAGFTLELLLRKLVTARARLAGAALLGLAFVYAWAELAVGIFFDFGS